MSAPLDKTDGLELKTTVVLPWFLWRQYNSLINGFLAAGGASCDQAKNQPLAYGFHTYRFTRVEPPFFGWIAAPWQPV